ncbi:hypothetical protein CH330_05130 [candidate division WOR-3 bacterium JGI_Cruoil_03_51_56]|uniref:Periplasmic heavy metal sensor n=1 Tax=candidate division WOR-3 bacterium JGI_Cruoil_03_51_56 TaxID=1973747 RepID=A0A235BV24_UNCW3|nr:MAG: hypothetical protein CH330_05130 [candidate division WOR-3 bacterium JGI_Cruoil_03_51_56]
MKKTSRWLAVVVVVAGLAFAGWAIAQEKPENAPAQAEYGIRGLDLTTEQLDKVDLLRMDKLKEVLPMRTDIRIKEMELAALWRADEPSAKKIIAKIKEIGNLRTKLEIAKVNQKFGIYKILTPEQRKKAKRFLMGRRGRRTFRGQGHRMRNQPRRMRKLLPPPPEEP